MDASITPAGASAVQLPLSAVRSVIRSADYSAGKASKPHSPRRRAKLTDPHKLKPRRPVKDDAAMAVLLPGGPTPNSYAARRTSFNATLSFAFRFLTKYRRYHADHNSQLLCAHRSWFAPAIEALGFCLPTESI